MEKRIGQASPEMREIGRWKKKVEDQGREIARLRSELEESTRGMWQLHRVVDAILAELVMRYGEKKTDGVRALRMPEIVVMEEPRYVVQTTKDETSGEYIIRVFEKE